MSLLDDWAWAEHPNHFYMHDARRGFRSQASAIRDVLRLGEAIKDFWIGPVSRMVSIDDDQIDVSETWRPRRVRLDPDAPAGFVDLD